MYFSHYLRKLGFGGVKCSLHVPLLRPKVSAAESLKEEGPRWD